MKERLFQAALSVRPSPLSGYGVFAEQDFSKGDLIEECHLIEVGDAFLNYSFNVKESRSLALGYGCIYNHAENYNANYKYDKTLHLMRFKAYRPIKKGEEILINYGAEWFRERGMKVFHYTPRQPFFKNIVVRFILIALGIKCFLLVFA